MSVQPRLIQTEGYAVLSGVQMIVKAGLECGVESLVAAHLDGPVVYTELLADHAPLLSDKGVRTLTLPDACQGIAALQSAWLGGRRAVGVFDAEGVIDAAGVLLDNRPGGDQEPGAVVLAFGDCDTSRGQASVALLRRAGWVVIEPSLQDEVKTFTIAGLTISSASGRPVALALPSELFQGAATAACAANRYPAGQGESTLTERAPENVEPLAAVFAEAKSCGVNASVNPPGKDEALPLSLITVGRSFAWTRQAMAELNLVGRIPMLRLGMLSPLDTAAIRRHAQASQRVLVLDPTGIGVGAAVCESIEALAGNPSDETPRPIDDLPPPAEDRVAVIVQPIALAVDAGPAGVIEALRPWLEAHPTLPRELVASGLARLTTAQHQQGGLATEPAEQARDESPAELQDADQAEATGLPSHGEHPPPGSSLVDLSAVIGRLRRDLGDAQRMLERHRAGPIDLSIYGELDDAARLLLSQWSPLDGAMEADGRLAGALSAGVGELEGKRAVVLMTSRRFFSLGASTIADAVRAGRDAVFIIHTEDPAEALGPRRRWQRRPKVNALDMQSIVEGLFVGRRNPTPSVSTIDPADRPRLRRLLERLVLSDGVHVVIARRRRGPRYYRKASEVHQKQSARRGYVTKQGCLVHCPEAGPLTPRRRIELGILGVEPAEPGHDPWTVSVSWSWHDESVMHALADPSIGLAILERNQPERSRVVPEDLDDLPEPSKPLHARADAWRATLLGITGSAFDLTLELMLEAGASMGYLVRSTHAPELSDEPLARRAQVVFTRHGPDDAPHVPSAPGRSSAPIHTTTPLPGQADLLLATELTEAARLLFQDRASLTINRTQHLIDTLQIPSITSLASGRIDDRDALLRRITPDPSNASVDRLETLPIAALAEWLWGHQRYAAWVYLGYLAQRGLVPLTTTAIDAAGVKVLGVTDPRSAEALKVGRKLAVDPDYASRTLDVPTPDLDAYLRTLADDLAEQAGSRRGTSLAGAFQALAQPLIDDSEHLDDDTRRELLVTAQRCVLWAGPKQGPAYGQRFADAIRHVIAIDNRDDHELTRTAMRGLSQAMLIPDEVYLAALLTAPARYRRDRRRLNISLERGDKFSYIHVLRPEFDLFKRRVAFTITLGERALKTLAGLYALRRIRPGWYRTQRNFRDLYLQSLADLPAPDDNDAYRQATDLAACATAILGRGDNRRASVKSARRKLEKLLSQTDSD